MSTQNPTVTDVTTYDIRISEQQRKVLRAALQTYISATPDGGEHDGIAGLGLHGHADAVHLSLDAVQRIHDGLDSLVSDEEADHQNGHDNHYHLLVTAKKSQCHECS